MSLRDVFCQDRAIGILQRGLAADRAAHAYLFAGTEGVGKFKTAREWARSRLWVTCMARRGSRWQGGCRPVK
jgi:DNA polymerase III gamma/tau subunit